MDLPPRLSGPTSLRGSLPLSGGLHSRDDTDVLTPGQARWVGAGITDRELSQEGGVKSVG